MKILTHETRPRWYGLSWRAEPAPTVLVRIHRQALDELKPIHKEESFIQAAAEAFGFTVFAGDFTRDFGFDGSLARRENETPYITFAAELPQVCVLTSKKCADCGGRKKDRVIRGEACYGCDGTGKEHAYDWRSAQAVSASLALLFEQLYYYQGDVPAPQPQLLAVQTGIVQRSAPISGMYGIELSDWFRRRYARGEPVIAEMAEAMRQAYSRMMGSRRADRDRFRASISYPTGWLNTDVPGDACGTHAADTPRPGEGYEFYDHNTDHPVQQLSLLAGLAALHDLVDKELMARSSQS